MNDSEMPEDALTRLVVPLTVSELTELAVEWQRMARSRTERIARSQVAYIELNESPTPEAIAKLERVALNRIQIVIASAMTARPPAPWRARFAHPRGFARYGGNPSTGRILYPPFAPGDRLSLVR